MNLTEEQISKVLSKLNETKAHRRSCSICGNNEWNLNSKLFEIREFRGGNSEVGGETVLMPLIAISCKKCGHIRFMNAIRMGAVPPEPDRNEEK